jgi:hypothetical protein
MFLLQQLILSRLLSLSIYADHLKFLRFRWNNFLYEFSIVLPFGLASASRVFTNLVKPTISHLHA